MLTVPILRSGGANIRTIFAIALLAVPPAVHAQERSTPAVSGGDLAWLGAGLALSVAAMQVDDRIAHHLRRPSFQERSSLRAIADGYALVNEKSLFVAGLVTYGTARIARAQTTADVALHTTEAIFVSSAISTVIRGALGRSRPFVTGGRDPFDYHYGKGFSELRYRAFPSIHSSAAFSTAAALTSEMHHRRMRGRRVAGPLLYTLAAGPGLARMYHDKHWASDVVMGAVLGTVSGVATVRYTHGNPTNRVDRWLLERTTLRVTPDGEGVVASMSF